MKNPKKLICVALATVACLSIIGGLAIRKQKSQSADIKADNFLKETDQLLKEARAFSDAMSGFGNITNQINKVGSASQPIPQ